MEATTYEEPSTQCDQDVSTGAPVSGRGGVGKLGNTEAATTYLYAQMTPPVFLKMEREFETAVIADEPTPPSTLRRQQIANLAVNQRLLWQVVAALEARGVSDKNGKLRVNWLQRIDALTSQCKSISQLLGLKREARDITPQSPADFIAAAEDS